MRIKRREDLETCCIEVNMAVNPQRRLSHEGASTVHVCGKAEPRDRKDECFRQFDSVNGPSFFSRGGHLATRLGITVLVTERGSERRSARAPTPSGSFPGCLPQRRSPEAAPLLLRRVHLPNDLAV